MLFKLLLYFVFFLPFQFALSPLPNIDLALSRLLAIFLFFLWLFQGLKNKRLFIQFKIQTLLLFSFLFFALFSIVVSLNYEWSLRKILFLMSFFPLFFLFSDLIQNSARLMTLIKFLTLSASIAALGGILQFVSQFIWGIDPVLKFFTYLAPFFLGQAFSKSVIENSSWLVNVAGNDYLRSFFIFPDPHMFSFFLGMIFPWSVALAVYFKNRTFWYLSAFVILSANLLTFSRGGYWGLGIGVIFAFFIFRNLIPPSFKKKLLIFFMLLLLVAFLPFNPISQRILSSFDLTEGSNQERLKIWRQSLEIITKNPVLGVGIGNYSTIISPNATYREPIYAHNIFLDIAVETGIFNALIFAILVLLSIRSYLKKFKTDYFYSAGAISLVIFLIHSFFETPLFSVHILPLLIIVIAISATDVKIQKNSIFINPK